MTDLERAVSRILEQGRVAAVADAWDCDAYGLEGREFGAACFFAGHSKRVCASLAECREKMTAERQRVWQRIQDGAARGDPDMVYLAGEFTGPEQLLGGGLAEEDRSDEGSGR